MSMRENNSFFQSLGRPKRDQVVTKRNNGYSSTKALNLLSSPVLSRFVRDSAKLLIDQNQGDKANITQDLFNSLLLRVPKSEELNYITNVDPKEVEDLLWIVLNSPEFNIVY